MISELVSQFRAKISSVLEQPPASPFSFGAYLQAQRWQDQCAPAQSVALVPYAPPRSAEQTTPRLLSLGRRLRTRLLQNQQVALIRDILASSATRSAAEQKAFVNMRRSALGVGLGVAGLFFFPLLLAGLVCGLPLITQEFKVAYHHLRVEKRFSYEVLSSVMLGGALLGGFFFTLIAGGLGIAIIRWLGIKTEDHSKQEIIDLRAELSRERDKTTALYQQLALQTKNK